MVGVVGSSPIVPTKFQKKSPLYGLFFICLLLRKHSISKANTLFNPLRDLLPLFTHLCPLLKSLSTNGKYQKHPFLSPIKIIIPVGTLKEDCPVPRLVTKMTDKKL